MKIAIIGGTGLLGSNLVKLYKNMRIEVQAFSRSSSSNIESILNHVINFDNLSSKLDLYFQSWQPNIIINTIALVNLSKCEEQKEYCYRTNVEISENLAIIARKYHSYYIQISTDHYYSDNKKKHNEVDPVILLNYYAQTKKESEKKVLCICKNTLVVRTNIIGFRNTEKPSFFEWLLGSLEERTNIDLFNDFYTSPISVRELGIYLVKSYENKLTGIYNIASSEVIDKYSFGILVAKKFKLSEQFINKCSLSYIQKQSGVKRALNLGLDVSKIEQALNVHMPSIDKTLTKLLKEYKETYNDKN